MLATLILVIIATYSSNAYSAAADGIVTWNPSDAHANVDVTVSADNLDVEITGGADTYGVRSTHAISSGDGYFYLEVTDLFHGGANDTIYSVGIATADAALSGSPATDTALLSVFGGTAYADIETVGIAVDYSGDYPLVHFVGDSGSGVEHLTSMLMRDTFEPVYLYLSAYRSLDAVSGTPQHRLNFGGTDGASFVYDPEAAMQLAAYAGDLDLEYGWPIDRDNPTITLTEGDQVALEGSTVSYTASAVDADSTDITSSINWYLDGVLQGTTGGSISVSPAAGEHSLTAVVQDSAELNTEVSVKIYMDDNEALDQDNDGLSYYEEINLGTDPGERDSDGDGLFDGSEISAGTDPLDPDHDGDGMPDGYEVDNGLNPLVDDAATDTDSDGDSNLAEYLAGREAGNANDDTDYLVLLNASDASITPAITLESDSLSFSVENVAGVGGVRSDTSISSGSGWHYFEGTRLVDEGAYGFGVAIATQALDEAAGDSDSESLGVATDTGLITFGGATLGTITDPELVSVYGIAVDYSGVNPVVHVMVRPTGGDFEVFSSLTMTGVTGDLYIFAYGESQSGVVQQSVNTGASDFVYSPNYLLNREGISGAETMQQGWHSDLDPETISSVKSEKSVDWNRDAKVSRYVTVSEEGQSVGYSDVFADKYAIRANQGMKGEFRYWEAYRHTTPENTGFGLIGPYAHLDIYCCVPGSSPDLTAAPPSMSLNAIGGVWRNLDFQTGYDTSNEYYGFAVDYRGTYPIVYVIVGGAVIHEMTMDDFITPIFPMLYGGALIGPEVAQSGNFGETPFYYDAVTALTTHGVSAPDLADFKAGWGPYEQNLHYSDGSDLDADALPSLTYVSVPTSVNLGDVLTVTATATDAEDGSLTSSIEWLNDTTADTDTGGTYDFTPVALGEHKITAVITDSSGSSYAETVTITVVDGDVPVISLVGANPQLIEVDGVYAELGATCTDNVDGTCTGSIVIDASAVDTSTLGDYSVTYDYQDAAGNDAVTVTRTVTVQDTTAPVISLVGANPQVIEGGASYVELGATCTDNVDGTCSGSVVIDASAVNTGVPGGYSVTYDYQDAAGNDAVTVTRTVTVQDTTAPVISLVGANPQLIEFNGTYAELGATCTDNVDGTCTGSIVIDASAVDTSTLGDYSVTYDYQDAAGNDAVTVTRTVTVQDTTAPVISLVGANPQVIEGGASYVELGATCTDNVDGTCTGSIVIDASAVNTAVPGGYSVTYDYQDAAGNDAATVTRTVTVQDTTAPVLALVGANPQVIEGGASYVELGATCTDNVDGTCTGSIVIDASAVNTAVPGGYSVTYDYQDAAGNDAVTVTRTVTVQDTTAPVLALVGANPQVIEGGASYVELGATCTDNVDGTCTGSIVIDASAVNTAVPGGYSVTYDYQDAAGNDAVTVTRTVTVQDTTAPVISLVGANPQVIEGGASYVELGATCTDNVDGTCTGSIVIDASAVNTAVPGGYSVTYDYQDAAGNDAVTVTRTVTVQDTTAPVISLVGANPQVIEGGASYVELGATCTDNVDGTCTGSIVIDASAVNTAVPGGYSVTYDYTDAAGNPGVQVTRTVTVQDTTAPVVTAPGNISVNAPSGNTVSASDAAIAAFLAGAVAADNVDGAMSAPAVSPPTDFPIGVTTITFRATDSSGNPGENTATVTVVDTGAPVVSEPSNINVAISSGTSAPATESTIAAFLAGASANDDVDGALAVTNDAPANFPLGTTTVTFSATDAAGNTGIATADVIVADEGTPVVTVPADISIEISSGTTAPATETEIAAFLAGATATDDVDGSLAVSNDAPADFPLGATVVTFSAEDSASNIGTNTATVTVSDVGAPVITVPADLAIEIASGNTLSATDTAIADFLAEASAVDDVDGEVAVTNDAPEEFTLGDTLVEFSAEDAEGNVASSSATLTLTSLDNDADGMPNAYEEANGLDPDDPSDAAADTDGDGLTNLEEYEQGTDVNNDDVAPVLTIPVDLEVPSTGPETPVDLGEATAFDANDGDITPEADITGPFVPGRHVVTWTAVDAAGNSTMAEQVVDVIPLVSLGVDQFVGEGSEATVTVTLNGSPVAYPVSLPYTVSGTASNPEDHDASADTLVISEGLETSFVVNTVADGVLEGPETVVITLGSPVNAVVAGTGEHTITLAEDNIAPEPAIVAEQDELIVTTIAADLGLVTLSVVENDPNPEDTHVYDWSQTNTSLVPQEGYSSATFTFDPASLAPGLYELEVMVTDDGVGALSGTATGLIRVISSAPVLGGADSDGDGTSDAEEGMADADGDRILDYLDNNDFDHQLQAGHNAAVLQVASGLKLSLGETALASGSESAFLTLQDVADHGGENGGAMSNASDDDNEYLNGVFDFEISGLPAGGTARVVIPQSAPIPANASYRKYSRASGWGLFVENAENVLESAPGELGVCPAPGDASYVPGLTEGHYCVQLTLQDGGANDADGIANGVIKDPGAVTIVFLPDPSFSFQNISGGAETFEEGAGEYVVFGFALVSDSAGAELNQLTFSAEGSMDEATSVGSVRLYIDENQDGFPDLEEEISTATYAEDDGQVVFALPDSYALPAGETHFLVTYEF